MMAIERTSKLIVDLVGEVGFNHIRSDGDQHFQSCDNRVQNNARPTRQHQDQFQRTRRGLRDASRRDEIIDLIVQIRSHTRRRVALRIIDGERGLAKGSGVARVKPRRSVPGRPAVGRRLHTVTSGIPARSGWRDFVRRELLAHYFHVTPF